MRIILAILLSLSVASAASAYASPPAPASDTPSAERRVLSFSSRQNDEHDDVEDVDETTDDPRVITLPTVVAPLSRESRLTGFAFVQVRFRLRDGVDIWGARENAHYALDALVRAAHSTSLAREDGAGIDHDLAAQVWGDILRNMYGTNTIDTVEVVGDDIRLLR
jgi:hypothetical protein